MKKLIFGLQVLSLVMLLPIYLVVELNRAKIGVVEAGRPATGVTGTQDNQPLQGNTGVTQGTAKGNTINYSY